MEDWREIEGYEGIYSVSNLGRVRRDSGGIGSKKGRILRPGCQKDGSRNVMLSRDSRPKNHLVHRLVAAAFLPTAPTPNSRIQHIDGDKSNNTPANLRWQTVSEMLFRQVESGTQHGRHHGRQSALSDLQILAIRADHRTEREVAKDYGIAPGTVGQIRRRKTHTHLPPREGDYQSSDRQLRLTDDQVRAIRRDTRDNAVIAHELGCSSMSIWAIRTLRAYAHVPDEAEPPPPPLVSVDGYTPPDTCKLEINGAVAEMLLPNGHRAYLDTADIPLVQGYRWYARKGKGTYYVSTRMRTSDGRVYSLDMHRVLMTPTDGLVVDHISTDGLDNRRANLRLATVAQNNLNSRVRSDNVSGLKGAFFNRRKGNYYSRIKVDGRNIWLGNFTTAEDAAEAYAKASVMYHGEFGRSYLDD
jgi:hypothetical protein